MNLNEAKEFLRANRRKPTNANWLRASEQVDVINAVTGLIWFIAVLDEVRAFEMFAPLAKLVDHLEQRQWIKALAVLEDITMIANNCLGTIGVKPEFWL